MANQRGPRPVCDTANRTDPDKNYRVCALIKAEGPSSTPPTAMAVLFVAGVTHTSHKKLHELRGKTVKTSVLNRFSVVGAAAATRHMWNSKLCEKIQNNHSLVLSCLVLSCLVL